MSKCELYVYSYLYPETIFYNIAKRLVDNILLFHRRLSLLWYHTIVRPFFALDGSNVKAGVAVAKQLIAECHTEFHSSALFLFFAGRVERLEVLID